MISYDSTNVDYEISVLSQVSQGHEIRGNLSCPWTQSIKIEATRLRQ